MATKDFSEKITPFSSESRGSGLLLHITSLPSPYGIGDLGPGAYVWIDRLYDAGQTWWQPLPFGPTGYSDSPYQSLSSFVGNVMLISPDFLIEDGLLRADDCRAEFSPVSVKYEAVIPFKRRLLDIACANFRSGARKDLTPEYDDFCHSRGAWLEDYALFRALKAKFDDVHYLEWPIELVHRVPSPLADARACLAEKVDQIRLTQFLLFRQANRLKEYAKSRGIRLIGDLPFFVSSDSSDVWTNPDLFLLDERHHPRVVAGVPPDYFNAKGQRWGNPVYDWDALRKTGFKWWIDRIRALLAHVGLVRLDHFRAFVAAWHIPASAPTAENGEWMPGPGAEFFHAVEEALGSIPFIAEDLGIITQDVAQLRDQFQIPGTRVLHFAFDGNHENVHLPENYPVNAVVYTGTHDNPTSREWFLNMRKHERWCLWSYLKRPHGEAREVAPALMRLAWSSPAALAIAPLQDVLNLGREGRMNLPGTSEGNWRWRATTEMLSASNFEFLKDLTHVSNRWSNLQRPVMKAAS